MAAGIAHRHDDADLYAAAGLPCAVYRRTDTPATTQRVSYDARIGTLVHQVLANVAQPCQSADLVERTHLVDEAVHAEVRGRDLGGGDKARLRVTGLVSQYLDLYLPPADATFLGAEVPVALGRVDLAWSHPDVGLFYDEVKTWRHHTEVLDEQTLDQVHRYLDAGLNAFGERFAGVRLLTLGNRGAALGIDPDGFIERLRDGPLDLTATTAPVDVLESA